MTGPTDDCPRPRLPALSLMVLGMAAGLAAGCTTQPQATTETPSPAAVAETPEIDLETEFLIGPSKVRELGYRIDNQPLRRINRSSDISQLIQITGRWWPHLHSGCSY